MYLMQINQILYKKVFAATCICKNKIAFSYTARIQDILTHNTFLYAMF